MRKNAVFSRIDHFHSPKIRGSSSNWKKMDFTIFEHYRQFISVFLLKCCETSLRQKKSLFYSIWAATARFWATKVIDTWKNCIFSQFSEFLFCPILSIFDYVFSSRRNNGKSIKNHIHGNLQKSTWIFAMVRFVIWEFWQLKHTY